MKLHPHMVIALYLREHPSDTIVYDDGKMVCYNPFADKYLWTNPNNAKRNGIYEAKGLMSWWKRYLKECENYDRSVEEDLPF